ncbi:hypothetical protein PAXRUDRAFT_172149 [Paxillus rubicundulus Ve08.2h10]|uniref:DUF6830 domain-containing protein n=1 Tax=Paxillus rubicundulus Ve08.2h10 TaxID=930991 RepID=A0A0D0BWE8_9AGAM|nr:hypothetical protein PAXRUDRAFT_172149 [Paxillus rubicundulus Ve08.2h10]
MLSCVRRVLSKMEAETRFTAPCPICNHFLKGIISNNSHTALHVTMKPNLSSMTIDTIQQQYHLLDFTNTFYNYLCQHTNKADLNKAFQMPLKTWLKFHMQLLSVHNGRTVMPSQVVQAYPPCEKIPCGNCDTVLLNTVEQPLQLNGVSSSVSDIMLHSHFCLLVASVAQVQVVFQPKICAPAILPPWLSVPLLYVKVFQLVHHDSDMGMWIIDQQFFPATDGQTVVRLGRVILLTNVSHPVELIPIYGTSVSHTVTASAGWARLQGSTGPSLGPEPRLLDFAKVL